MGVLSQWMYAAQSPKDCRTIFQACSQLLAAELSLSSLGLLPAKFFDLESENVVMKTCPDRLM
jgi:hypothetical protein